MENLAWAYLSLCFACALILIAHLAAGHGQKMFIMNLVWPVTALYWGPVALWFYFRESRSEVALAATHCGAGCVLGDIVGEFAVSAGNWNFAGNEFFTRLVVDFVFAWSFGIAFQYFTIVPMRRVPPGEGLFLAIRADTFSIVAFQIGMSCWMALAHFVLFPDLRIDSALFWFMMQIAMMVGFFASYPANAFLLKAGWKERMT